MVKRLSLALFLLTFGVAMGGCHTVGNALNGMSGVGTSANASRTDMALRQWGADSERNGRFVDTYFLNYDINDPYRGDRLSGY